MTRILVIEDDEGVRSNVLELLTMEGFEVLSASDGVSGVDLALRDRPDLVLCDITMPGMDGYEVFELLNARPETMAIPFIYLSARAARADVRRGMTLGADDFITKPFSRVELLDAIRTRLRRSAKRSSVAPARPSGPSERPIVQADPRMKALFTQADRAATGGIAVLLLGETGVGKEVVARYIHQSSGRPGPFIALNCAALSESLLESELFGHERGAFTGASQTKPGLFEAAAQGTLFLDEVGEISTATQVKLLRVLEDHHVLRVGGRTALPIDVRFVSATNRDLEQDIAEGHFREDLYYRLNGVILEVPPLRERPLDILALIDSMLASASGSRTRPLTLSAEAQRILVNYAWPGNIRELRNVIERAALLCNGDEIGLAELPAKLNGSRLGQASPRSDPRAPLLEQLHEMDRRRLVEALRNCGGNQTQAAALLGISRRTLVTRLNEFELPRPRKKLPSLLP